MRRRDRGTGLVSPLEVTYVSWARVTGGEIQTTVRVTSMLPRVAFEYGQN